MIKVNFSLEYLVFDILVVDPLGNKICSLLGAQIAKHGGQAKQSSRHYDVGYQPMSSSKFAPRQLPHCPDYAVLDDTVVTIAENPSESSYIHILDPVRIRKVFLFFLCSCQCRPVSLGYPASDYE
jgi:hypothetical protein